MKASFFAAKRAEAIWLAARYTEAMMSALRMGYLLTEEYYLAMVWTCMWSWEYANACACVYFCMWCA